MARFIYTLLLVLLILFQNGFATAEENDKNYELGSVNFSYLNKAQTPQVPENSSTVRLTSLVSSVVLELVDLSKQVNFFNNFSLDVLNPIPSSFTADERYEISASNGKIVLNSKINKGDSTGVILNDWLSMSEIIEIEKLSKPVYPLTSLRVGQPFNIIIDPKTSLIDRFEYDIDKTSRLIVELSSEGHSIYKENIPYEVVLGYVEGNINSNFYNAVMDSGENANFAYKLARVFAYDIDFFREIRQGDKFTALVEKRYRENEFIGYGRILGATFFNDGDEYEAYLFFDSEDPDSTTYFKANGQAVQKAFLRTPVDFTRVSSGYTMARKHPILGITRPHQGIDYAAPTGTPIVAVADGKVTRAAYTGGYGHLVKIQHKGGLLTQYAHMSKYGRGIKSGVKVKQGQVIGYVGSTGLSTGPHLDFRIQQNGKFVNPDHIIIPAKMPVEKAKMQEFNAVVEEIKNLMLAQGKRSSYNAALWLDGKS